MIAQEARFLAMSCGTQGRIARKDNLLSAAGRFLLSREEALQIVDRMIEVVRSEWEPSLRRAGASDRDCGAVASARLYDGLFIQPQDDRT
jgi:serine/threonine-protein kinase HipA